MIQECELLLEQKTEGQREEPEVIQQKIVSDCPELALLSNREQSVLQKILEDKKRKDIAEELFITENTVKKHISNIFAKLGVSNRHELLEKINKQ